MESTASPRHGRPRVTILTPVYNEELSLPLYEAAVRDVFFVCKDYDFSILLIDDGSADRSWPVIQEMCARDARFRGIRLSRNFGSHVALSAAFTHADGDAVATLACDLQDPPETILEFLERWRTGARIVWGRRRTRDDGVFRALTSALFSRLIGAFAMPHGSKFQTGSFLLVDRRVAECFRSFREQNRITFALVAWTGFEQTIVEYDRLRRRAGKTGWSLGRLLKTFYDAFIGFSFLPIRAITLLGASIFLLSIPLSGYVLFGWFTGNPMRGWTSVALAITLFSSVQCLIMGVLGEYLYRIYAEVVRRPLYFVADDTANGETRAEAADRAGPGAAKS